MTESRWYIIILTRVDKNEHNCCVGISPEREENGLKEIHVTVRDGIAFQTDHTAYITGDGEFYVIFALEDGWKDLPVRVARFQTESGYQDVMFRGERCHVPVFSYAQKLEVGLTAGNLRTTTPARIFVRQGIRSAWGPPEDPQASVFDQILDCLGESDLDLENTNDGVRLTLRYRGGEKTAYLRHSEVYVGSGDMPEGYRIQLDPNGGTAILKVRDEKGNIIPIPSIRGEKGDKGEDGRPGRDGQNLTSTVNGHGPDGSGNILLTAKDLGALALTGGNLTGALSMGGFPIRELGEPGRASDAASKGYVDGKRKCLAARLSVDWIGTGPYTQTVFLEEVAQTDTPHIGPAYSEDLETAKAQAESWQCVSFARAADGKILFTCLDTKPTVEIPIQVEVIS